MWRVHKYINRAHGIITDNNQSQCRSPFAGHRRWDEESRFLNAEGLVCVFFMGEMNCSSFPDLSPPRSCDNDIFSLPITCSLCLLFSLPLLFSLSGSLTRVDFASLELIVIANNQVQALFTSGQDASTTSLISGNYVLGSNETENGTSRFVTFHSIS